MNILEEIANRTKSRVEKQKQKISYESLKQKVWQTDTKKGNCFKQALMGEEISFICEIKKASPSKGLIAKEFPYLEIAKDYEKGGASAISVLTEPYYFQGKNQYLMEIEKKVQIPILRKDFTIDAYQIYEAKYIGASAILLICALLDEKQLEEYLRIAKKLDLSALVEVHDEDEIKKALSAGAEIIGVNNRDLKTFQVDLYNSIRLREKIPNNIIFVAESGIRNHTDVALLKEHQVNAVLVGETMMRAENRVRELQRLRYGI